MGWFFWRVQVRRLFEAADICVAWSQGISFTVKISDKYSVEFIKIFTILQYLQYIPPLAIK